MGSIYIIEKNSFTLKLKDFITIICYKNVPS
jgi:hypothetical protein